MHFKKLLLPLLLCITAKGFAQDEPTTITTNVTKATILSPGASFEKSIGHSQTLFGHAFISTAMSYSNSSSLGSDFTISFNPAAIIQYRHYYNYNSRQEKGKRTEMNSMNYISATYEILFAKNKIETGSIAENKRQPINSIGAVWGLQRNYAQRFSIDANVGLGYLFTSTTVHSPDRTYKQQARQLTTMGQISFGFWLNKKTS